MAAKKSTGPNKTQFVVGFSEETPIAEIIAKGKEQGIELKANQVSAIRSTFRRKLAQQMNGELPKRGPGRPPKAASLVAAPKRGPGRPPKALATEANVTPKRRGRPPRAAGPAANGHGMERELLALVVDHGMRNVEAALGAIRQRLQRSFA